MSNIREIVRKVQPLKNLRLLLLDNLFDQEGAVDAEEFVPLRETVIPRCVEAVNTVAPDEDEVARVAFQKLRQVPFKSLPFNF
jgi:hypothetical protein